MTVAANPSPREQAEGRRKAVFPELVRLHKLLKSYPKAEGEARKWSAII